MQHCLCCPFTFAIQGTWIEQGLWGHFDARMLLLFGAGAGVQPDDEMRKRRRNGAVIIKALLKGGLVFQQQLPVLRWTGIVIVIMIVIVIGGPVSPGSTETTR